MAADPVAESGMKRIPELIKTIINGQALEFEEGVSILEASAGIDVKIPTLCHDERLKPIGSCRMCLVQVEGKAHPVTACNTALIDGMVISTHTPSLENERRMLLRMLAQDHPREGLREAPDKPFYHFALQYGLTENDFNGSHQTHLLDDSHPYIHVDMSQCIMCYRCVRICDEVQGQFVWQVFNRGHDTKIVPDSGTNLRESSCVSCGACVDTCPSGALEDKSVLARGVPTNWTRTTCPYCGTGCEMNVGSNQNQIVSIEPLLDAPVSQGHLCVKGRYAFDFVSADDRITEPLIRKDGDWHVVTREEAISFTAKRLKSILEEHGPESIGVLGSARGTNEENYLAQKFARVVVGTNNVDCCARVCHTPTAAAMKLMLGTGAATNSYNDIEKAQTILVCGANATENHPIVGARIKQAALGSANLIVIDSRKIELAQYAKIHLQPRPGTNIPLLNAIANTIVEERLFDHEFASQRVTEWDEFCAFIKDFAPEKVEAVCGIKGDLIRQAARLYATSKPSMCFHGLGVTEHTQGTEGVMCLVNLALLTGNIGKPGTGINPLRGQNNVQGAAHMGCDPGILTGSVSLHDATQLFESVWRAPIPWGRGLNMLEMMDAAEAGRLKALWAIGYDIALTNANTTATERALGSLELVIVQDLFLNETARQFGSVFLPAASSFERDGTFMNAERRIQRIRKAIEPVGQSKPDWEIICSLAKAMGKAEFFNYNSAEEIWDEIRKVWPAGSGITYPRLDHGGLQWPCPSEDHPGTEVMHGESFPIGKTAALRGVPYRATKEVTSEEFPFLLITGRTLYQFNAGTMTMRTANAELRATDLLDISAQDAKRLQLTKGEQVHIHSRYGKATLPIRITSAVRPGELFATFHTAKVFLNRVTSPYRDRYVKSPEYKVTAVRIEKE
ncbi:MAG: formate dehydrogenase subunit alpha [Pyrinomonadaceae bacterium]|nr:formate dehydrogenase subunit alpha [Pyrinomonadaceae bacterium]